MIKFNLMVETAAQEKFKKDLLRVHDALLAARERYNIWYIYKHDRPKYVDVMNRYLGFFSTSISAQFTAMLLTLSKVLDKNTKKRISIYSLVESAEKNDLIELSKLQEIRNRLSETVDMFEKLQKLRNNVFAHLGNIDTKEAFKRAGITPNDLRKLIESSNCILQDISYAYDNNRFAFLHDSEKDTYSLLNDLLKMHN